MAGARGNPCPCRAGPTPPSGTFALHPWDPALVYAYTVSGQIYRTNDGGKAWNKLPREFGEIRALAWLPG